ncbi:MAG: xanthine dehydrogenase family protein molybdopterin-binding subunit [Acidimicrobiia bacterium]
MSILGNVVVRREDPAFLTTGATYIEDIDVPGAAHAVFARSAMAHARVNSIDVSAARSMPGVVAIYTAADLGNPIHPHVIPDLPDAMLRPLLAIDTVRFVGEAIAMVIAETRAAAADAAEAVIVDYDPLPPLVDPEIAITDEFLIFPDAGTNIVSESTAGPGADFSGCEVVLERRIVNQRMAGAPLEGRAAIAKWEDGRLIQWATCQGAHPNRLHLAKAHGLDPEQVRVIVPDVGGGFGSKARVLCEEIAIGMAAKRLDRPVRWVETRTEDMLNLPHGRGQIHRIKIGGRRDGTVTAYSLDITQDSGAYPLVAARMPAGSSRMATGVYHLPNVGATGRAVATTTTPVGSFRGAGRPEAAAAIERAMDLFATEIAMDPVDVRFKNFVPPFADRYTTGIGTVYDTGDYAKSLRAAIEAADYWTLRTQQAERRAAGTMPLLGIGVAVYVEVTSGLGSPEYGSVELQTDGTILAVTGSTPSGQGHETTWAMIIAERLGVPMDAIRFVKGDSDLVPSGSITGGSRSVQTAGVAMSESSLALVDLARPIVASLLEAADADIVFDPSQAAFHVAGTPARTVGWADIAAHIPAGETLKAETDFKPSQPTYPFGAHIAVVEVDPEIGKVTILRFVAADDAGTLVNPMLAAGQVHGGIGAGIGQALFEEIRYDNDGNPLTATFADYGLPSAAELPSFELVKVETPTFVNPLGAKGIGESGTIGATPAIQNAVIDALAHLGVRHIDLPLTSERVWRAANGAIAQAGSYK